MRFLEVRRHPHYLYFFSLYFSLFIVVKEASLLWRAKFSVGSSYEVLDDVTACLVRVIQHWEMV